MAMTAVGFGVVLIVVGVGGYVGTGATSLTALIPAGIGLVLVLLGLLARKDNLRKHAMHAAAAVGLISFVSLAVLGLPKVPTLIKEGKVTRTVKLEDGSLLERDATAAVVLQLVTGLVCAVFVGLCVNSFIQARRARSNPVSGSGTAPNSR
jgi:hypothetical protein